MTFAQFVGSGTTGVIGVINTVLVPLIISLSFLVFFWGVFKYFIWGGDNESSREEGRQYILWGIISLAVIFSVWGLVSILLSTLGITPLR